jgi:hypothetical protein
MTALDEAAAILTAHRSDMAAEAVVVSFGSHGPNHSAMIDHYSVEILDGGVAYSACAKNPLDAASLAKLKAKDARELRERKAAKARGDAA